MPRFEEVQRAHSRHADADHFAWQTRAPYFAETEAALLDRLVIGERDRLLEIGCGEGANLHHLRGRGRLRVGVDFSHAKAAFAARHAEARALVGDGQRLPFADGVFDVVLVRDLLHHVRDRVRVLKEAHRVLAAGGRLLLIEPNARSPLIWLQAALVPAERGVLQSVDARLREELSQAGFRVEAAEARQPFPLARVLMHPKLPLKMPMEGMLRRLDAAAERVVPRRAWMYLVYLAVKA